MYFWRVSHFQIYYPMIQHIENLLIPIDNKQVLIDRDVARLYGVVTKEVNQAVKNNPDKFPEGYVIQLSSQQKKEVINKFDHLNNLKYTRTNPKAYTENALYMLASILRSKQATETTILIVETFSKIRGLQKLVASASNSSGAEKKDLLQKSGALMADLLDQDLSETESETSFEIHFAVLKLKHSRKRKTKT